MGYCPMLGGKGLFLLEDMGKYLRNLYTKKLGQPSAVAMVCEIRSAHEERVYEVVEPLGIPKNKRVREAVAQYLNTLYAHIGEEISGNEFLNQVLPKAVPTLDGLIKKLIRIRDSSKQD